MTASAGTAAALEFQVGENPLRVESLFTIGGSWRAQEQDPTLIGKSNLYAKNNPQRPNGTSEGLCLERTTGSGQHFPTSQNVGTTDSPNNYAAGQFSGCSTGNVANNQGFVNAPGSFSPNGDNGNLNFDKGDLVHATAKLLTDVNWTVWDYNLFVRGVALFDANYSDFTQTHYDTTMQASREDLYRGSERHVGVDYDILDYNIGHVFMIGERSLAVKLGDQVLNWGESSLLALNSLNTINPPDARRLNTPGLDLKEAFRPIGMLTVGTDLFENFAIETFYTYDWKPLVVDPVGTFFSQSDTLGPGGFYSMLSFAKQPEDPGFATSDPRYPAGRRGYYQPIDTCGSGPCVDTLGNVGSKASRTLFRDFKEEAAREPDGGDYGAVLKMFLENINNGTELALYAANYDSRLPVASGFAAYATCANTAADLAPGGGCGIIPGNPGTAVREPFPVDTARLLIEYPEDIRMYGLSFNTTVGDYALSGEYAFRENLPIQIDTVDLAYALLQPAAPPADIGPLPGRRSALPSFLTQYRGYACTNNANCIQPNQYVAGYERMKVGQANLTLLRLIGGDNPIGASQMTILFETGYQKVFDMPSLDELQFEGSGSETHISDGADGTRGINPDPVPGNSGANTLRQNPTAHRDYSGYGTSESYGYRMINLNRWDSAVAGINLETLFIARHDVKGTSPGIATNFLDGRKQFNFGIRGDYLSTYIAEVRYTWFTGGGLRDGQRDRDNIQVYFGYQF